MIKCEGLFQINLYPFFPLSKFFKEKNILLRFCSTYLFELPTHFFKEPILNNQYSIIWNGTDESGKAVASGIYFIRLETKGKSKVRKAVLLK